MKQNKNKENAIILMNSLNIVSLQFINKKIKDGQKHFILTFVVF